jgi:hypothetical protein
MTRLAAGVGRWSSASPQVVRFSVVPCSSFTTNWPRPGDAEAPGHIQLGFGTLQLSFFHSVFLPWGPRLHSLAPDEGCLPSSMTGRD